MTDNIAIFWSFPFSQDGSSGSLLGCLKNFAVNRRVQTNPTSFSVEPCSGIKEPGVFFGPQGGHVILGKCRVFNSSKSSIATFMPTYFFFFYGPTFMPKSCIFFRAPNVHKLLYLTWNKHLKITENIQDFIFYKGPTFNAKILYLFNNMHNLIYLPWNKHPKITRF